MIESSKDKAKMVYAFMCMNKTHNIQGYCRVGNGKLYENIKKSLIPFISGSNNPFFGNSSMSGTKNPFYGKTHTEKTKEAIRQANINHLKYNKNSFSGKTHSTQVKEFLSQKESLPVTVILKTKEKIYCKRRKDIGKLLGVSEAMGIQLCTIKRHLWEKYNIKEILYENYVH